MPEQYDVGILQRFIPSLLVGWCSVVTWEGIIITINRICPNNQGVSTRANSCRGGEIMLCVCTMACTTVMFIFMPVLNKYLCIKAYNEQRIQRMLSEELFRPTKWCKSDTLLLALLNYKCWLMYILCTLRLLKKGCLKRLQNAPLTTEILLGG